MLKNILFLALLIVLITQKSNSQYFTRVFDAGTIVTDSSISAGGSWCDLNNDGFIDLYVAGDSNFMYVNNRNGTFSPITSGHFLKKTSFSLASVWADFNNDGFDDMYLANYTTPSGGSARNFLYKNSGFPDYLLDTVYIGNDVNKSDGANWIDYDYDGDLDIYVIGGGNTQDLFYRNDGNNNFVKVLNLPFLRSRAGGHSVFVDYDNDNDLDLFIVNRGAPNELYKCFFRETNRADSFSLITNSGLSDDGAIFDIGSNWGDYDNDGYLDVFLAVSGVFGAGLPDRLYHNNGDGTFTRILTGPIVANGTNSSFGVWGDYDNDGDLDLFVAQVGINPTISSLYRNDGAGVFTKMTEQEVGDIIINLPAPQSGYWGDYDNDGDLDMCTINYRIPNTSSGRPQPNYLIKNNQGNSNNWIFVKCQGTVSNRSGGGAKVRIKAVINSVPVWQQRYVHTGTSSFVFQDDSRLHFGLGNTNTVDSVVIEWPSGIMDTYTSLQVNKFYVAIENTGITIGIKDLGIGVPNGFNLYQNYPNPFNPGTEIKFDLPKGSFVNMFIYDMLGREVAVLVNEQLKQGSYSVSWDASGRASGIYFYKLEAGSFVDTKKMVLIK